jgi:hypothetical protein
MQNETLNTRAIVETTDGYHAQIRAVDYTDNTIFVECIEGPRNGKSRWVKIKSVKPIEDQE